MVTKTQTLPRNPERVAWTVLVASFLTFVVLAGTLLFGGSWWLRNASTDQNIAPVYSGAVQVTRLGRPSPEVNPPTIPVQSTIVTLLNVQATLNFASANGESEIANVQIFGGSTVEIVQANSPRFSTSTQPHHIILRVTEGRVRAFVGIDADRPVIIEIRSGSTAMTVLEVPGTNALVEVTPNESMVTVREGEATVQANDGVVVVAKDQRAEVPAGGAPGPVESAERNLIINGDFGDPLDGVWVQDIRPPGDPNESPGTVQPAVVGGRRTIRFDRTGINFGQVGIVQTLDRDLRGYTTLRLQMDVMITNQDLINCGGYGSECPLMVKIDYVDIYGSEREWLQGYFYNYVPGSPGTHCITCGTQWRHEPWPKGQWQIYASPNLLDVFAVNGTPAALIRAITLYASGHTFTSFVTDVQLLAE